MEWAASYIAENGWDEWTPCNCYSYTQVVTGKQFPLAQFIKPNGPPQVGSVAIMNFDGVIHYQVVTGFDENGFFYKGANRQPCVIKAGHDDFGDSRLVGFWTP